MHSSRSMVGNQVSMQFFKVRLAFTGQNTRHGIGPVLKGRMTTFDSMHFTPN